MLSYEIQKKKKTAKCYKIKRRTDDSYPYLSRTFHQCSWESSITSYSSPCMQSRHLGTGDGNESTRWNTLRYPFIPFLKRCPLLQWPGMGTGPQPRVRRANKANTKKKKKHNENDDIGLSRLNSNGCVKTYLLRDGRFSRKRGPCYKKKRKKEDWVSVVLKRERKKKERVRRGEKEENDRRWAIREVYLRPLATVSTGGALLQKVHTVFITIVFSWRKKRNPQLLYSSSTVGRGEEGRPWHTNRLVRQKRKVGPRGCKEENVALREITVDSPSSLFLFQKPKGKRRKGERNTIQAIRRQSWGRQHDDDEKSRPIWEIKWT